VREETIQRLRPMFRFSKLPPVSTEGGRREGPGQAPLPFPAPPEPGAVPRPPLGR